MDKTIENKMHVFEAAGLGKAPFKCVGLAKIPPISLAEANPTAYNNALRALPPEFSCGTCSYCGQALMNNFLIKSSDGKTFSVGCECVAKTGDYGLKDRVKLLKRKAEREKRDRERKERFEAEEAAQRERNGGLTDWEVQVKKNEEIRMAEIARKEKRINLLQGIADRLRDGRNGFRDSIAYGMTHDGSLPIGRGIGIVCDILAKQCGRYGSKAYDAEYAKIEDILTEASNI